MQRKYRIPLAIGEKAHFVRSHVKGDRPTFIKLLDFSIRNNRVECQIEDSTGKISEVRVRNNTPIQFFNEAWVTISMPIQIHVKTNGELLLDFIFLVPGMVSIEKNLKASS